MKDYDTQPARSRSWHYILLWLLVLVSLGLNAFLIYTLYNFQQQAKESVSEVTAISEILNAVESVELHSLEVPISIDETLPISLTVPFKDTFTVPIQTTIPISTSIAVNENIAVPINDVVSLNRNARIFISVLGQSIPVDIPIRADIPLNMQTNVPINLEVPVNLEVPIDMVIEVPVDTEVPINAEVPVQMEFPVTIPVEDMGLNDLLVQVQEGLRLLVQMLEEQTRGN
ncbi:MAG: hypothetical protein ACK2UK_13445 [Candidatus Promineifilaceae bacterium]